VTVHSEQHRTRQLQAIESLEAAADAPNRHEAEDRLADALVLATLAQASATADVADALRALAAASRPMGGRL
jgi:hypothetical protein